MKKYFVLIAAAIVCMSASAQVQFGAKVGFDLTNLWGSNVEHGMKPSYQAGLMMEYKFNPRFAISPEVVFASQGGKFDILNVEVPGIIDKKVKATFNTNYINVPVMLKYYATPSFSIDFGPQVGFNVYSKYSVTDVDKPVDLKDATKGVDFGLGLGGTYSITDNAFIQARYTMGLTNVFKSDDRLENYIEGLVGDTDAKNGNIQIAFGMKF